MHITYYLKGNDYLKWGNKDMAKVLYLKSIQEKADYPSPYVGLAQFDFDSKNYQAAIDTCRKVLVNMKPDTDTRYQAVKIAEAVIYVYLEEVKQQIANKEFDAAMQRFEAVKTESRGIPGVKNFQEFSGIQELLYKGYYNQMVELAKDALLKRNFLSAHHKIDSMADFRQQHSNSIINPSQEHILLKELYAKWVEQGKAQVANNYPDSALFSFMQAKLLCKRYEVVYCTEALDNDIFEAVKKQYIQYCDKAEIAIQEQLADSALTLLSLAKRLNREFTLPKYEKYDRLLIEASQLKYAELITEGDDAFAKNKMREAMAFYQEALEMEKQVQLNVDAILPAKIREVAKNQVLQYCVQVESLVDAMNLPDASHKLVDAKRLIANYKLETDSEISEAIAKVVALLNQGKCNQALFDYNVQLTASKKFIEKREFIYASQSLEKANVLVKQHPDCQLDASVYSNMYNDISAMLHYQKQMIQIDTYIEDKEYSDAVELYVKLSKFYNDSCDNNFGIAHKKIDDYFISHPNTQFIDFGVRYYVDLGKIAYAMELLDTLRRLDYISGWSRASQEALGEQLALLDIEKNPEQDPKIKVIDYTKNDKWYRFLKKVYLQQWKNR
jgi:hypothetical protein